MKSRLVFLFRLATFAFFLIVTAFPAKALQFFDDFSTGSQSWFPGPTWSVINPAPGVYFYESDCPTNDQAWRMYLPVGSSWQFQSDVAFTSLYGTAGIGSLALAQSNLWTTILADVKRTSSGSVRVLVSYFDTNWITILDSGYYSSSASVYHVTLSRAVGEDTLQITVQGTNGFVFSGTTPAVPESILDSLTTPGYRANSAVVNFANLQFNTPVTNQAEHYLSLATNAMNDLITNFWVGDPETGQILSTHGGVTNGLVDPRGVLWERATFYFDMNDLWQVTGDPTLQERMSADWTRTKSVYTTNQLEACGTGSKNVAVDDSGWTSLMYLDAYQSTGDPAALTCAEGLVTNAFNRWSDDQFGGGLWYNDSEQVKSLYQVAIALAALRIYEQTDDGSFSNLAMGSYSWMETHLLRTNLDNLYWCDYNTNGPVGQADPYQIAETNSVVYLGGNMGMAVMHACLYRLTGDTNYLNRAIRTANAIFNSPLAKSQGVYLNDRDAFTEGVFAGDWARDVLTLPGIDPKHWEILWTTADSIYTNARTTNGYYGGSWSGPAEGPGSAWWLNGSIPQQITVSSSSGNMIMAAAALEAEYASLIPPQTQITLFPGPDIAVANAGQPGWPCQLQSSTNLAVWNSVTNFYADPVLHSFNFDSPANGAELFYRAVPLIQP